MNRRKFSFGAAAYAALSFAQEKDPRIAASTDLPVDAQYPASTRGQYLARLARSIHIQRNIPYVKRQERSLNVSIYMPATDNQRPLPVILCFGLAAWQTDTSDFRLNLDKLGPAPTPNIYPPVLVSQGYAVVAAQLRSSKEAPFPAQIQDCQASLAWILREAPARRFDVKRIGLLGASASGHLVSLLALMNGAQGLLDSSAGLTWPLPVRAVCSMSGFYDFEYYRNDPGDGTLWPQIRQFLGCTYEENPQLYRDASPQHYVGTSIGLPAFFLDHGIQDRRVPYSQAARFYKALQQSNAVVGFEPINHYHHGPEPEDVPDPPYTVTDQRMYHFFERHLKSE